MSPTQVTFAIEIIKLVTESIAARMSSYQQLLRILEQAQEEKRDLTTEEVAIYENMANKALEELGDVIDKL